MAVTHIAAMKTYSPVVIPISILFAHAHPHMSFPLRGLADPTHANSDYLIFCTNLICIPALLRFFVQTPSLDMINERATVPSSAFSSPSCFNIFGGVAFDLEVIYLYSI